MEKIRLSIADGSKIIGAWEIPIYWILHFGREDIIKAFQDAHLEWDQTLVSKIIPIEEDSETRIKKEHFIIRHDPNGGYTIEDRNMNPLTYLNNQVIAKKPVILKEGDIITLPLVRNKEDRPFYLQFKIIPDNPQDSTKSQMKQLMQCSQTAEKFITIWEEENDSRDHFAVRTYKPEPNSNLPPSTKSKNLRPASQVPCPYCGNMYIVFCVKCKLPTCYNGEADKIKCAGCKKTYRMKDMVGNNIDVNIL